MGGVGCGQSNHIVCVFSIDDWLFIFGDPTKFGLGVFITMFGLLFICQHYVIYPKRKRNISKDTEKVEDIEELKDFEEIYSERQDIEELKASEKQDSEELKDTEKQQMS